MAGSLGVLSVDLIAKTGGFHKNMKAAERSVDSFDRKMRRFSRKMRQHFDSVAKRAKRLSLAIVALGGAFTVMAKKAFGAIDNLATVAAQAGTTAGQIQVLHRASEVAGVSIQSLDATLARYTKRLGKAAQDTGPAIKAFDDLGISAKSLVDKDITDQLEILFKRLNAIEDPARRAADMERIFGDSWKELVPLMQEGSAGIAKARQRIEELGGTITRDGVQKSEAMLRAFRSLSSDIQTVFMKAVVSLAPELEKMARQFATVIENAAKSGKIERFFKAITQGVQRAWPVVKKLAAKIEQLVKAMAALKGATSGASIGSSIGGVFGPVGRLAGGAIGGAIGGGTGYYGSGKALDYLTRMPEQQQGNIPQTKLPTVQAVVPDDYKPGSTPAHSGGTSSNGTSSSNPPDMAGARRYNELMSGIQGGWAKEWKEKNQRITDDLIQQFGTREEAAKAWFAKQKTRIQKHVTDQKKADQLIGNAHQQMVERINQGSSQMSVYAHRAAENMQDAFAQFLFDPFDGGVKGMLRSFTNTLRRMAAQAAASKLFDLVLGKKGNDGDRSGGLLQKLLGGDDKSSQSEGSRSKGGIIEQLFGGGDSCKDSSSDDTKDPLKRLFDKGESLVDKLFGDKGGLSNLLSQSAGLVKNLVGSISQAFKGMGGGGWGGLIGGAASLISGLFHSGGIAGGTPTSHRMVGADTFKNAPRFHSGGHVGPGEVPAILKKGEGVFTKSQMANLRPAGAAPNVTVTMNNQGGTVENQSQRTRRMPNGDLHLELDNMLHASMQRQASDGRLDQVMAHYAQRQGQI